MTPAGGHPVAATARVRLAVLAGQAIAVTDGVTATSGPAGRWQTTSPAGTVAGVLAVEDGRGRVELELHVAARWPTVMPLEQLAEHLRARVRRSAGIAGMDERLGAVAVAFDDVITTTESV